MDVKISLPLLPLRDIVVFPSMVIPLFVGRDKSISALNEVMKKDKKIILVTQKNSEIDDPKKTDIFMYGCEGSILQLLKLPDGTVKVLVEGIKRVKILDFKDNDKFITCDYAHYNDVLTKDEDLYPLAATALRRLEKLTSINKKVSTETINTVKQLKDPSQIADNIASHITATISEKQQIFETVDVKKSHVGLTFIRNSTVEHESFSERAPNLGGLVEFYRSPDRVAWSPTGVNVPDYPKLAQIWWQQIGDVNSGSFTPQEAMDRLAEEMDITMARMQAVDEAAGVYGGCGPRLNEERSAEYWYENGGAKPPLDNEKPQGVTVNYDKLVERWSKN